MTTAVTAAKDAVLEQVIIQGDLSRLTPKDRIAYYRSVCESVGLNPLTKPFEYITLNGKLTLYALRACTDQLRGIHDVSIESMEESEREGVFIVTAKAKNGKGRTDMAKGAVSIASLKGEALANAMMKAETKAKRRATLSLCGLGFLDETEVETIPGAKVGDPETVALLAEQPAPERTKEQIAATVESSVPPLPVAKPDSPAPKTTAAKSSVMPDKEFAKATFEAVRDQVNTALDNDDIDKTMEANAKGLKVLKVVSEVNWDKLKEMVTAKRATFAPKTKAAPDDFIDDEIPA